MSCNLFCVSRKIGPAIIMWLWNKSRTTIVLRERIIVFKVYSYKWISISYNFPHGSLIGFFLSISGQDLVFIIFYWHKSWYFKTTDQLENIVKAKVLSRERHLSTASCHQLSTIFSLQIHLHIFPNYCYKEFQIIKTRCKNAPDSGHSNVKILLSEFSHVPWYYAMRKTHLTQAHANY